MMVCRLGSEPHVELSKKVQVVKCDSEKGADNPGRENACMNAQGSSPAELFFSAFPSVFMYSVGTEV